MENDLSYILNHLGEERENYYQAVSPPVFQSSNFTFNSVADMRASIADEMNTPFYTRGCNPTVQILRKKLAALEGTEEALVLASGSAAMSAALLAQVKSGDHIVCVKNPYSWTGKLLRQYLHRFGVEYSFVEGIDPEDYRRAALSNTKVFILESPNSMNFVLQDIRAVTSIAKEMGIITILDNSYSTPLYQRAMEMGVDICVYSASKYFGGHSDIVAGVITCNAVQAKKIFLGEYMTLGGIISPHDAWLMIRGLRTLPIRLERIADSTRKVVEYLQTQPRVEKIFYPFLPENPQYELAMRQMKRSQGLFSILLKVHSPTMVDLFCDSLQRFLLACSWGGHESLILPIHGLSISQNYKNSPYPWNLIRFYIGLEDPEVLIEDIKGALKMINK